MVLELGAFTRLVQVSQPALSVEASRPSAVIFSIRQFMYLAEKGNDDWQSKKRGDTTYSRTGMQLLVCAGNQIQEKNETGIVL